MPAEISRAISGFVRDIVSLFVDGGGDGEPTFGDGILRKTAHFIEFACLGGLLTWLYGMLDKHLLWTVATGFCVASVDETIQRFVPGRGPRFTDVMLDTAGVVCGLLILLAVMKLCNKKQQ